MVYYDNDDSSSKYPGMPCCPDQSSANFTDIEELPSYFLFPDSPLVGGCPTCKLEDALAPCCRRRRSKASRLAKRSPWYMYYLVNGWLFCIVVIIITAN